MTKCLLSTIYNNKNRSFFASLFLYTLPVGIFFFLSRNTTFIRWLLERLAVNYFELFESLNFETVQDVKIGPQAKD